MQPPLTGMQPPLTGMQPPLTGMHLSFGSMPFFEVFQGTNPNQQFQAMGMNFLSNLPGFLNNANQMLQTMFIRLDNSTDLQLPRKSNNCRKWSCQGSALFARLRAERLAISSSAGMSSMKPVSTLGCSEPTPVRLAEVPSDILHLLSIFYLLAIYLLSTCYPINTSTLLLDGEYSKNDQIEKSLSTTK